MRPEYEQMELDTRRQVDIAISKVTEDAITEAREMIGASQVAPAQVRNRHEAYGIAAEQYAKISKATNNIKADTAGLLATLADPNFQAIEATSSIVNSTVEATATLIKAAAEMKRTLADLYIAETREPEPTPLELLAGEGGDGFEEAEPAEAGEIGGEDAGDATGGDE
nr:hypothetical protein [uncultured Oscillibacter sp.]